MQSQGVRRSSRPTRIPRRYSPYGSRTTALVQAAPVQAAPPSPPPRASIFTVYDFPYVVGQAQAQDAPAPPVKIEVEDAPEVHAPSTAPLPQLAVKQVIEDAPEVVSSTPLAAAIKTEIEVQAQEYTPDQLRALEVKQEIEDAPEVTIKLEEPVPFRPIKMEIREEEPAPPTPAVGVKTEPEVHQESESVQEFLQRIYSEVQQIDAQHKQRTEDVSQLRHFATGKFHKSDIWRLGRLNIL